MNSKRRGASRVAKVGETEALSYTGIIENSHYLSLQNKEIVLSFHSPQRGKHWQSENVCLSCRTMSAEDQMCICWQ